MGCGGKDIALSFSVYFNVNRNFTVFREKWLLFSVDKEMHLFHWDNKLKVLFEIGLKKETVLKIGTSQIKLT